MNWQKLGREGWQTDDGQYRVSIDQLTGKWHVQRRDGDGWRDLVAPGDYPSAQAAFDRAKEAAGLPGGGGTSN